MALLIINLDVKDANAPATVAAFLRIIYASIRFSPDPEMVKRSINQLKELETFKKITLLCRQKYSKTL